MSEVVNKFSPIQRSREISHFLEISLTGKNKGMSLSINFDFLSESHVEPDDYWMLQQYITSQTQTYRYTYVYIHEIDFLTPKLLYTQNRDWHIYKQHTAFTQHTHREMHIYIYIYIYIYIVIHRQTVSLYHNSSVWLDMYDAWSWDRNLPNFSLDLVSDCLANKRTTSA